MTKEDKIKYLEEKGFCVRSYPTKYEIAQSYQDLSGSHYTYSFWGTLDECIGEVKRLHLQRVSVLNAMGVNEKDFKEFLKYIHLKV